jgi:hypothetical protein
LPSHVPFRHVAELQLFTLFLRHAGAAKPGEHTSQNVGPEGLLDVKNPLVWSK